MDEKLKEALMHEVDKRITSLENDKNGLETELSSEGLIDKEKTEFSMDLETVNKELEVAKNEKQNIEDLYSQKNKLQQEINQKKNILQKRRTSLQHDKEQLEEELSNVKDDRIKQQFQNDLDKINKELEIVSDGEKKLPKMIEQIDNKIDEYLKKYKVDKEKITSEKENKENKKESAENKENNNDEKDSKIEKESSDNENKQIEEENSNSEDKQIEENPEEFQEQDFDEFENEVIGSPYTDLNEEKNQSNNISENEVPDLFQAIEIDANSQTIRLMYKDEKNNKELPIKEALGSKKSLYKRIDLENAISKYCKEEKIGLFGKIKLKRGIDPSIVQAISTYGINDDLIIYMDSIAKDKGLPFDIHYNLTDSNLDRKSFNALNKYAKRDRNIEGITAEGVRENVVKRFIKGIKEGNVLKVFEKPKQIAEHGVKKVKDVKDITVDKVKNTKNNVANKVRYTRTNVANKTADKMVKFADKIRVDGNAEKVAKEYKEKQSSEYNQNVAKEEKTEENTL